MSVSRRDFVLLGLAGVGALIGGCAAQGESLTQRPGPLWPQPSPHPTPTGYGYTPEAPAVGRAPVVSAPPASPAAANTLQAIPRSAWAAAGPIANRINAMNGVKQITVHHEGWTVVNFSDYATTAKRMDSIRRSHLERLGAGDIGYHFVIDRAGRLWQGRDLRYQGAHVREHNPHNLGIMCLGNFDKQRPTDAQITVLRSTLRTLMAQHKVPLKLVYTHQELNPTECPGKVLQGSMVSLRRNALA
ncbi:MAG: peptidoglycan recognition family protein [Phycisphaeraceae bacterium]